MNRRRLWMMGGQQIQYITLPQYSIVTPSAVDEAFEAYTDWTAGGAGVTRANNTTQFIEGTQSVKLHVPAGVAGSMIRTVNWDMSAFGSVSFSIYLHTDPANLTSFGFRFSNDAGMSNYMRLGFVKADSLIQGEWTTITIGRSYFLQTGSGTFNSSIVRLYFYVNAAAGGDTDISFDNLRWHWVRKPFLMLHFDDGSNLQYTNCFTYMKPRKLRGSLNMITNNIGGGGSITAAQLQEMDAAGWAICNHTDDHTTLTGLSEAVQEGHIGGGITALNAIGLTKASNLLAYPAGGWDANTIIAMANLGVPVGRDNNNVTAKAMVLPWYRYYLVEYAASTSYTLATAKTYINNIISDKTGGLLVFHRVGDTDWTVVNFQALMDWIVPLVKSGSLSIITMADYYKLTAVPITLRNGVPLGNTYYVDGATGNDTNNGLTIPTAWQTINKAEAMAFPGDTVIFRAGTYTGNLIPANNGAPGLPITFTNFPGETVIITHNPADEENCVKLTGRHYIIINGLTLDGNNTGGWVEGSSSGNHNTITNCTMLNLVDVRSGIYITTGNYWQIVSNTMSSGSPAGTAGDAINMHSNYHLIENNTITNAMHDCILDGGQYNVVRKNTIYNLYKKPAGLGYADADKCSLWENNVIIGGGTTPPIVGTTAPGMQLNKDFSIIRHNIFYDTYDAGISLQCYDSDIEGLDVHSVRIYNNVIYNCNNGGLEIERLHNPSVMSDNIYMNNAIIHNCLARTPADVVQLVFRDYGAGIANYDYPINASIIKFNNLFHTTAGTNSIFGSSDIGPDEHNTIAWGQAGYPTKILSNLEVDPGFINAPAHNFHLLITSGMIGAGGHMTTANGAGVNSTALTVLDAKFFCDGYGIVSADWIKIGAANPVQILSINYTTNVITLAEARTWGNGDNVDLYKDSSGNIVSVSGAPYIGAYEYA